MSPTKDPQREHRIDYEIMVDCYNDEETVLCWYYYLENKCTFPFYGLWKKQKIKITEMAPEEDCTEEMIVYVEFEDDELPISLSEITAHKSADAKTKEAVEDWYYWIQQGYRF